MERVTAGVIGLGSMGLGWHCKTLHRLQQFDLIAGCDPSPQRRVCEKPFCMNLAECDEMIAAAERSGTLLSAYQNRRWDGGHLSALDTVQSGILGDIFFTKQLSMSYSAIMHTYGVPEFRPQWRAEKRYGGGMLYDFGAHRIDQLLHLLAHAPVRDVYADLRGRLWSDEVDDCFLVIIRFHNGITSQVEHTAVARLGFGGTLIVGRDGSYLNGKIKVGRADDEREFDAKQFESDWDRFYCNLHAHLTEDEAIAIPLSQTRQLMAIIDAALRSSQTGQVISVGDG